MSNSLTCTLKSLFLRDLIFKYVLFWMCFHKIFLKVLMKNICVEELHSTSQAVLAHTNRMSV